MSEILKENGIQVKITEAMKAWREDAGSLREKNRAVLTGVSPAGVIRAVPIMLNDFTPEEVMGFYKAYIDIFLESLPVEKRSAEQLQPGHPLKTLWDENREILRDAGELAIRGCLFSRERAEKLRPVAAKLRSMGFTHYDREEMILFPYLEKKGVSALITSLWRSHDRIREGLREMNRALGGAPEKEKIREMSLKISEETADTAIRETDLLYPTAYILLSPGEWAAIKEQEGRIGYYGKPPEDRWKTDAEPVQAYEADPHITDEQMAALPASVRSVLGGMQLVGDYYEFKRGGDIELNSGYLLPEEIDALINHLPLDVTFIDSDDRVRFFSENARSFVRTPSVLGRLVWFCHPPKSVSTVEKIIEAFRNGEKDEAEFWITINGRLMHIRYFAVRDRWGDYIGTLETVQDITDLKRIEGERRLLDWED